jgi:hypothetical protein
VTSDGRQTRASRLVSLHTAIDIAAVLAIVLFGVLFRRELAEQMAFYWPTLGTALQYLAVSLSFRAAISKRTRSVVAALLLTLGFACVIFPGRHLFIDASDLFLVLYCVFIFLFLLPAWWLFYFMMRHFLASAGQRFRKHDD